MAFDKGHEKLGGRKKGARNRGTDSIKTLLNTLLPEEELAKLWKKKLYIYSPQNSTLKDSFLVCSFSRDRASDLSFGRSTWGRTLPEYCQKWLWNCAFSIMNNPIHLDTRTASSNSSWAQRC
jgi:hypothetical protein